MDRAHSLCTQLWRGREARNGTQRGSQELHRSGSSRAGSPTGDNRGTVSTSTRGAHSVSSTAPLCLEVPGDSRACPASCPASRGLSPLPRPHGNHQWDSCQNPFCTNGISFPTVVRSHYLVHQDLKFQSEFVWNRGGKNLCSPLYPSSSMCPRHPRQEFRDPVTLLMSGWLQNLYFEISPGPA